MFSIFVESDNDDQHNEDDNAVNEAASNNIIELTQEQFIDFPAELMRLDGDDIEILSVRV